MASNESRAAAEPRGTPWALDDLVQARRWLSTQVQVVPVELAERTRPFCSLPAPPLRSAGWSELAGLEDVSRF